MIDIYTFVNLLDFLKSETLKGLNLLNNSPLRVFHVSGYATLVKSLDKMAIVPVCPSINKEIKEYIPPSGDIYLFYVPILSQTTKAPKCLKSLDKMKKKSYLGEIIRFFLLGQKKISRILTRNLTLVVLGANAPLKGINENTLEYWVLWHPLTPTGLVFRYAVKLFGHSWLGMVGYTHLNQFKGAYNDFDNGS